MGEALVSLAEAAGELRQRSAGETQIPSGLDYIAIPFCKAKCDWRLEPLQTLCKFIMQLNIYLSIKINSLKLIIFLLYAYDIVSEKCI